MYAIAFLLHQKFQANRRGGGGHLTEVENIQHFGHKPNYAQNFENVPLLLDVPPIFSLIEKLNILISLMSPPFGRPHTEKILSLIASSFSQCY